MKALMHNNKYMWFFRDLHTTNGLATWLETNLQGKVAETGILTEPDSCKVWPVTSSDTTITITGDNDYVDLIIVDVPVE